MRFGWMAAAAVVMGLSAPAEAQVQASGFIDTGQIIDLNVDNLGAPRFLLRITSLTPISAGFFGNLTQNFEIYSADGTLENANDRDYGLSDSGTKSGKVIDFVERTGPLQEDLGDGRTRYNSYEYSGLVLRLTGGAQPTSYSVQLLAFPAQVPEPATWTLMILGFGAIGGALRHRRPRPRLSSRLPH